MNAEQFNGHWAIFKDQLKQQWGRFTDADLLEISGSYEKFVRKVDARYGEKKTELMQWADHWHQKSAPAPVANTAQ